MSCAFSKEVLALYAGGDLADSSMRTTQAHLKDCAECLQFCEQLEEAQSALRSLRKTTARATQTASVRQDVLSRIESAKDALGWRLRIERFIIVQLVRRPFAYAVAVFAVIVSISSLAQIRPVESRGVIAAALFDSEDKLLRPVHYRDWVLVGASVEVATSGIPAHVAIRGLRVSPNVYVEPSALQTFQATGTFPEGTVLVLEMVNPERNVVELQASVKDSTRFAGDWGYFGFVDDEGSVRAKAQSLADSTGCRGCHEARAETDHVFTQFYPILRVRRG